MTERLDRIEGILERLAERQDRFQEQLQESSQQSRTQLSESSEDVVGMIGSISQEVENLAAVQRNTQLQIDALAATVTAYVSQSTASRAAEAQERSEFLRQMLGLQTETRNILRELADMRRQQGNGNG
jgi:uncharacterized protein YutE (UPF0331/DUF86 family)